MITSFKKVLLLSASVLIANGFTSACFAEATASNVLGNLLESAAGAISQEPAKAQDKTPVDEGETALPIFDDPVETENSAPAAVQASTPAAASAPSTESAPTVVQNAAPTVVQNAAPAQSPVPAANPTPSAAPAIVPATLVTAQELPVSKKRGFIGRNGDILIAPEDIPFPAELKEGMWYYTEDIDALKQKIASGEQVAPFSEKPQPEPTVQSAPAQNGEWLKVAQDGQVASQTASNGYPTDQQGNIQPNQAAQQQPVQNGQATTQQTTTQNAAAASAQATPDVNRGVAGQDRREQALNRLNKKPITFMCYVAESPDMPPAQSAAQATSTAP